MLPSTTARVPRNTASEINERIARETEQNIVRYAKAGPKAIGRRLKELNREWDIERTLEANAASVSLLGLGLGAFVNRRLFALPAIVAGFLLQHALQGWCPPVPILRRLGFRTQVEIEAERFALKVLRGDFEDAPAGKHSRKAAHEALAAVGDLP